MTTSTPADGTVDPRVERSRRVIRKAALEELAEVGYGGFTIESVAERAGAGKSTVYRHWGTKLALVMDALETLNRQPPAPADAVDGPARARVERLLAHLSEALVDSAFSACVPALVEAAEHDAAVARFLHGYSSRRRAALVDAVADGVASGEFRADLDPDLASQALAGAVFYRRLLTGDPFDPARVPDLVELLVAGAARR